MCVVSRQVGERDGGPGEGVHYYGPDVSRLIIGPLLLIEVPVPVRALSCSPGTFCSRTLPCAPRGMGSRASGSLAVPAPPAPWLCQLLRLRGSWRPRGWGRAGRCSVKAELALLLSLDGAVGLGRKLAEGKDQSRPAPSLAHPSTWPFSADANRGHWPRQRLTGVPT